MKLHSITFAFASAICILRLPTTLADECTEKQLQNMENGTNRTPPTAAEIKTACPSVNATVGFDLSNLSSFDFSGFMASSPCKDESCTVFLKKQLTGLPDCEYMGFSVKTLTDAVVQFCVDAANGKVTESDKIFGLLVNMTETSSSMSTDDSPSRSASAGDSQRPSRPDEGSKASTSDNAGSSVESDGGASVTGSNATASTPAPTKSSAGALWIATATTVVMSTVLTAFSM